MYGRKSDVLGGIPQQDPQQLDPGNRYVFQPEITMPWLEMGIGHNYDFLKVARRNVPFKVVNQPQPVQTRVQRQEEQIFTHGGLAFIPDAGLWPNLFGGDG